MTTPNTTKEVEENGHEHMRSELGDHCNLCGKPMPKPTPEVKDIARNIVMNHMIPDVADSSHLYFEPERDEIEQDIIDALTSLTAKHEADKEKAVEAERERIVEIIKEELRNAPLEVRMNKGIIFANVIQRIAPTKTDKQTSV